MWWVVLLVVISATTLLLFFWNRRWYAATRAVIDSVSSGDLAAADRHLAEAYYAVRHLSVTDPRKLMVMLEDSKLASARGKYSESARSLEAVIAACVPSESTYRNIHSRALLNLAEVKALCGDAVAAERSFLDAAGSCETYYGANSREAALILNRYADFLVEQQRFEEAKQVLDKVQRRSDRGCL